MGVKICFNLELDLNNQYYSFIKKTSYSSTIEFKNEFVLFLTNKFSFIKLDRTGKKFVFIYDKIKPEFKIAKAFKELLKIINKYIDAFNSCFKGLGDEFRMPRMSEKCWEILEQTEDKLNEQEELNKKFVNAFKKLGIDPNNL